MISDRMLPELMRFRALEQSLPLRESPALRDLVVFGSNEAKAVHGWFKFKEGYSCELLERMLSLYPVANPRIQLLDPFCGSGTSLVSSQLCRTHEIMATGIERNPFLHLVARAKTMWPIVKPERLLRIANQILNCSSLSPGELPALSSIATGRCISTHVARKIVALRQQLESVEQPYRDILLLGLASCIEPLSRVRKDGRALRLVKRVHGHVLPTVRERWYRMVEDIQALQSHAPQQRLPVVLSADGRQPLAAVSPHSMDIVLTSPPYPNNIDYSEVYKLELWLLGFVKTEEEFLSLRKSTLRSHQSARLMEHYPEFESSVAEGTLREHFKPLLDRTDSFKEKWRSRLVLGYFADLWQCLRELQSCLRPNGRIFLVVANSLHGNSEAAYLIPSDILIAFLARSIGFRIDDVLVARNMLRRLSGNHFLRESILVMTNGSK